MTVKGKRIFNYRPLCIFAIALIVGIILGEAVYGEHIAFIIFFCVLSAIAAVPIFIFKKSRKLLFVPIAILIGLIGITTSNAVYDANVIDDFSGEFSATVASEIIIDDDGSTFYVSDVKVYGIKLKYGAYVFIPNRITSDYNAGDEVLLKGKLTGEKHVKFDSLYAVNRTNGRAYFAVVNQVEKLSEGSTKFPLNLQLKIKKLLFENTDEHTASICQALILGDKRGINSELYDNISASGLAHVLAVSGLHITTLAGIVYFILKKMKVNPKIAFVAVTVLTFLYSMICSFTASSLRAFIMCGVFTFASAFGQKRDNLSSLSLAAILILIFRPTAIMEVGFLLSFYAVLGIFIFYKPFNKIGMKAIDKISHKRHFGKRFVDVCAVSLATNLMTLPLVAYFFDRVPTLFVLSNFIVLPYVMAVYILLLVFTVLALITTFGGFVCIFRLLLIPFRAYVGLIGGLPISTIPISASAIGIVCFTLIMIFISRFVFLKRRPKVVGATVATSASLIICLLCALL